MFVLQCNLGARPYKNMGIDKPSLTGKSKLGMTSYIACGAIASR